MIFEPYTAQSVNQSVNSPSNCKLESAVGKQLKNAPVFYTVAQLRHNRVLKLDAFAPDIQERMRQSGYTGFEKSTGFAFTLQAKTPRDGGAPTLQPTSEMVERFRFFNAERTKGFVVEQNALAFQTTDYVNIETFATDFMLGIQIVHAVVGLAEIERLGLRYLDAVAPPNGEKGLATYLSERVLGIAERLPNTVGVLSSVSETRFQYDAFSVVARTIVTGGALALPLDLQLEKGIEIASRFRDIVGVHAVLDTDASIERKRTFVLDDLKQDLLDLRTAVGIAFDNTVTQSARQTWDA
jgi:uncharacterized protein (TIGR04255 family)